MIGLISRYTRWLHTRWPAGKVEPLPLAGPDGATNVAGLYIVGDVAGIPLLKFSSDTGARAVQTILAEPAFKNRDGGGQRDGHDVLDLVIIGGGVAGVAAAIEARQAGLKFELLEAAQPFATIVNFPKAKPIFTYPNDMTPAGELQFTERSDIKEGLVEELQDYMRQYEIEPRMARAERVVRRAGLLEVVIPQDENLWAQRVIVAIGRSGNFRKLGALGQDLDKVSNRLHDPKDYAGKDVLVVGGGDSALETAIALSSSGAAVTLSYRKSEFSRPKPENIEKLGVLQDEGHAGALKLMMASQVGEIRAKEVVITDDSGVEQTLANDNVFVMIGREPPLDFFRRSGVRIRGEWRPWSYISLALFTLLCVFVYHWKSNRGIPIYAWFDKHDWFPFNLVKPEETANLFGTIKLSMLSPGFYYSCLYCLCIVIFGIRRIRRRKTPYVTAQTVSLMLIQCIPLFLLPYILLPWMGHNGLFDGGALGWFADQFFPAVDYGQGREYWRAFGFILAWPLMFWNVFTYQPIWGWLIVSFLQTFVIIPFLIWKWGKGAYCGWICSCGALAETVGDTHRHKMPHGPIWNRLNMIGQVFLAVVMVILVLRIVSWITPGGWTETAYHASFQGKRTDGSSIGGIMDFANAAWVIDLLWAGIIGVAFYFWFSGRVWCRFACPLAALMHIYARFSRFGIIAEKKKCISCNVCTSICHQGIDVMSFANKGLTMQDPQCVRCSACVQACPTGVLTFGQVNGKSGAVIAVDRLEASAVRLAEARTQSTAHG